MVYRAPQIQQQKGLMEKPSLKVSLKGKKKRALEVRRAGSISGCSAATRN